MLNELLGTVRRTWAAITQPGTGGLIQPGDWRCIYLHQLAPHVRSRQAATLMYEAIVALDNAAADERRMDWLADLSNDTGQVLLPRECVESHPESMRAAIDMAMAMSSNV